MVRPVDCVSVVPFLLTVGHTRLSGWLVSLTVPRLVGGCGLSLSAHITHLRGGVCGQNPEKRLWQSHLGWPEMGIDRRFQADERTREDPSDNDVDMG